MTILTPALIRQHLSSLIDRLAPQDRRYLEQLVDSLDAEHRLNVADAQALLYPSASESNAGAYLRQLRGRINVVAREAGIKLAIKVSAGKRGGAEQRWLWIEGDDPTRRIAAAGSVALTGELDALPETVAQLGLPLEPAIRLDVVKNGKPVVRWFLSYAHKDKKQKNDLLERLKARLANSKHYCFELWEDGQILVGERWREHIQRALAECHIGVLLVSHAFLGSEFIKREELPRFIGRGQNDTADRRALPALLEGMDFEHTDMKGLETLQIHRDEEGKAYKQRTGQKRDAWVDALVRQMTKVVQRYSQTPQSDSAKVADPMELRLGRMPRALEMNLHDLGETDVCLIKRVSGVPTGLEKDPAEATIKQADQAVDVVGYLMDWVVDPYAPPIFALLGEYGMGKTITCQRLVRHLEEARQTRPELPIPIYLDLRNLTLLRQGVPALPEIVDDCIRHGWHLDGEPPNFQRLQELARKGGALFIFDGLDEALVHLTEHEGQVFTRELFRLLPPSLGKRGELEKQTVKLLVSCRTHYFRTLRDQKNHFTGQERGEVSDKHYRALMLLPFSDEQVADYLAKALPGLDVATLQATIRSVHNLTELTQRPYTLKLVSRFIPEIEQWRAEGRKVQGVTLYRRVVQSWLERDGGKHQLKPDHKLRLMTHVALELWRSKRRAFAVADLEAWFHRWLDGQADLSLRYRHLDPDKLEEDLRTATFLVRQDEKEESGFRFAHSSLQEFFLAEALLRALQQDQRDVWAIPRPSPDTLDFLGQMLVEADDPGLIPRLEVWRLEYQVEASETQLAYGLRAFEKGWPMPTLAGMDLRGASLAGWRVGEPALADSYQDFSRVNFSGADLRKVELRNLRLEHAIFSNADLALAEFRVCVLDQANLRNAELTGSIFRKCRLEGAFWDGANGYRCQFLHCTDTPALDAALIAPLAELAKGSRKNLRFYGGHAFDVASCAWSPDGARMASAGSDGAIYLWDMASLELISTLHGHTSGINACAWSPDGMYLASAGDDGSLYVWNTKNGDLIRQIYGHSGGVLFSAWSPNGTHVVSAGVDGTLRLWDVPNGVCQAVFSAHQGGIHSCAWSPDGKNIASAGDDGVLRLWDITSGTVKMELRGHAGAIWSCTWSPDGTRLASAGADGILRLWNALSGAALNELHGHTGRVRFCAWSPDGARLASVGSDSVLRLWDASSGALLGELHGHIGEVGSCAWSPDGRRIVTAGLLGQIYLWDVASKESFHNFLPSIQQLTCCAWSPDGSRLASTAILNYLCVWDAASGKQVGEIGEFIGMFCSWSPDGTRIASGGFNGTLRIWDVARAAVLSELRGHVGWVWCCSWSPDGGYLASAGADGTLRLWDTERSTLLVELRGHEGGARSCAWSPDGTRLASVGDDGTLRLWDAVSGATLSKLRAHLGGLWSCAWSPDGMRLAIAGADGTVRLWDVASHETLSELRGHTGVVESCTWSPDGTRLASAGYDGTVRVWDVASGVALSEQRGHLGRVQSCAWSPDGKRLASAGDGGALCIWDTTSGKLLRVHAGTRRGHAVWVPDEGRLIQATGDAWRWMGWEVPDDQGGVTRIPLESFGPIPGLD